jgi:hypothetical protein
MSNSENCIKINEHYYWKIKHLLYIRQWFHITSLAEIWWNEDDSKQVNCVISEDTAFCNLSGDKRKYSFTKIISHKRCK